MTSLTPSSFRARAVDHLALAIGTTKGLFFVSDGVVDGPFMAGDLVLAFAQLPGRYLTSTTDSHFGPNIRVSDDGGTTWDEPGTRPVAFPADTGAALTSVWQLHPDRRPNAPDTVWAGVEPAALFRSDDRGDTFELVRGLWDHPDRASWEPGFGGLALHTVVTHPAATRPDHRRRLGRRRVPLRRRRRRPGRRVTMGSRRGSFPSTTPTTASACTSWPWTP